MHCSRCQAENPDGSTQCAGCGRELAPAEPPADARDTLDDLVAAAGAASPSGSSRGATGPGVPILPVVLGEGETIGPRYEVVRLLGRGGMGAVYLVRDRELKREVALKFLREGVAQDRVALERFRREVALASKVTHRNVLRVFDIGEAGGLPFVTMQYVEGEDLATRLRRQGKLPLDELLPCFHQICEGLAAAHEAGVVHRDLKPQNILLDRSGVPHLADFGLAVSAGQASLTDDTTIMGTPHYISPEQVMGQKADRRSDIYSLGVILYEMATGTPPFSGATTLEIVVQRLQRQPRPVEELNPGIPPYLRGIVSRCLAVDPAARYQSCAAILDELDDPSTRPVPGSPRRRRGLWAAAALGLAAAALTGWWWLARRPPPAPAAPPSLRTVLIADFQNRTGDPVFDGTLEPAFTLALEGASFIESVSRSSALGVARRLQPEASRLDESLARLVAVREGVEVVTSGAIDRDGDGYQVSLRALDAVTGRVILEEAVDAPGKDRILAAATRLAARVRSALGDTTPESVQLAAGETFSSSSLEGAHEYALGQERLAAGRWDEAQAHYLRAVELDPDLGRAYAGLATVAANRGRRQEAERWFGEAMGRLGRMSEREKFRTRGAYFLLAREPAKAIEQLEKLLESFPADSAGAANLALAHFYRRDMARALAVGRRAVALSPRNVPQRNNLALYSLYASDFDEAEKEFRQVLEMNPGFEIALVGLALAQLAQGKVEDAESTYARLETLGPRGASTAAMGRADIAVYQGRLDTAAEVLRPWADRDEAAGENEASALKRVLLAEVELGRGRAPDARRALERAVASARAENVLLPAALVYLDLGHADRALELADRLSQRLEPDPQAYAHQIRAEVDLKRGRPREAVRALTRARELADTWRGQVALGRAYLDLGAFPEAQTELESAVDRRGEAVAAFLDEVPTYRLFPPVLHHLGRAGVALKDRAAAEPLREFLAIRGGSRRDPLVLETRRLLALPEVASTAETPSPSVEPK
jgi:tetratricopeptide (TPR) repeat protein/tRNA A-37 threonylcarbamoyl transferase component Bud32